jgi:hypothetical protein
VGDPAPGNINLNKEAEMSSQREKAQVYTRYPLSSFLIYEGATILHFVLGGVGIILGYSFSSWAGYIVGSAYLVFAFVQMYVIMPLTVCPNCVYYRMNDARCISGLNIISKRIAKEGDLKDLTKRGEGLFCHNNLYMAALVVPIIAMIPALILNLSLVLLLIFLAVVGLLLFRIFVVFTRIACVHCSAKNVCPNAKAMGLQDK